MIILDTNVISEVLKPRPDARVASWLETLGGEVSITAITSAELLAGLRRLPVGARRTSLTAAIESTLSDYSEAGAVLAFDHEAARLYADILVARQRAGMPISTADAQIAAICRVHAATCATRNTKDFAHTGIELANPWQD